MHARASESCTFAQNTRYSLVSGMAEQVGTYAHFKKTWFSSIKITSVYVPRLSPLHLVSYSNSRLRFPVSHSPSFPPLSPLLMSSLPHLSLPRPLCPPLPAFLTLRSPSHLLPLLLSLHVPTSLSPSRYGPLVFSGPSRLLRAMIIRPRNGGTAVL